MRHPDITTATVVDTCPTCRMRGQQLARYDHREDPAAEHRLCYHCRATWDI